MPETALEAGFRGWPGYEARRARAARLCLFNADFVGVAGVAGL